MSEQSQTYDNDSRTACKYGLKCYQKNPEHHKQFKHPPKLKATVPKKGPKHRFKPYDKQAKPNSKTNSPDKTTNHENKESDDNDNGSNDVQNEKKDDIQPSVSSEMENHSNYLIKSDSITYYDKDADSVLLKECFLVEMPEDFFKFYECLKNDAEDIEKLMASVNLQLVGPYELFMGKLPKLEEKDLYLIHWRFFYDPPEFQTVLKRKGKSEFHIGYYRDDPQEKPVFLAKNDSSTNYTITPIADNIFGAVYWFLQNEKKTSPFISIACQKLIDKVKKWADEYNMTLEEFNMKKRIQQIVCKTFHSAGIVVPYNKKTKLGYRKLVESYGNIKKMFKQLQEAKTQAEKDKILSDLQPVLTYASIAMDECDFGTGLEAGMALFCSGLKELQTSALKNLEVAYSLLGRDAFGKIIKMHMKCRRKGPNMSILDNS